MADTYKDKPDKYNKEKLNRRPKEKRFESSKGRKQKINLKNLDSYDN